MYKNESYKEIIMKHWLNGFISVVLMLVTLPLHANFIVEATNTHTITFVETPNKINKINNKTLAMYLSASDKDMYLAIQFS